MTQCHVDGCDQPADHTVQYEDPEESVPYCEKCGRWHYFSDDRAVSMSKGAE